MGTLERSGIGHLNFLNHLSDTIGPEKCRAFALLDFTHLFSNQSAVIEKQQQLLINGVNLDAQVRQA